jgi:IS5 family transposase
MTPTRGRSARAASTGRPGFGYKARVLDNDDGIVLDYSVECGAVPDGPQLAPAIDRVHRLAGQVPRAVTADRGYGQAAVERDLHAAGVRVVAIPRQATTSPARKALEHHRGFRKLVKWRTGCEGRIAYLKRRYGWVPDRYPGATLAAVLPARDHAAYQAAPIPREVAGATAPLVTKQLIARAGRHGSTGGEAEQPASLPVIGDAGDVSGVPAASRTQAPRAWPPWAWTVA